MNYLSRPYSPEYAIQRGDLNVDFQVLNTLQTRYDANKAIVDQTIAQYEMLKGVRDSDNEYIANKVAEVKSQIDSYGNLRFEHRSTVDSLSKVLQNVIKDPIVRDAVQSRAVYDNFNAEVSELKKKDPTKYNDRNYQYSLYQGGMEEYKAGKVKKLTNLSYIPYTDYQKQVSDVMMEFEKAKKGQTIEVRDGQGGITKYTKEGLTPEQIKQIAKNSLDVNAKKQMEIDTWASSNKFQDEDFYNQSVSFIDNQKGINQTKIDDLKIKIAQGGTEQEKEQWENNKKYYETEIKTLDEIKTDKKSAMTYAFKEGFLNNMVSKFSPLYTESVEYSADESWWKRANYNLDIAKFDFEKTKFSYTVEKDRQEKEQAETAGIQTITNPTIIESDVESDEKQVETKIAEIGTALDTDLSVYKTELETLAEQGDEQAKSLLSKYENNLKNKKTSQSDLDVFRSTILDGTMNENNPVAIIGNRNYFADIKNKTFQYETYLSGYKKAKDTGQLEHIKTTLDTQETFSAFFNNKNTKMMAKGKDGKERAFPVYKVLQANGLMDENGNKIGDLTSPKNKVVLDKLKKSYYADMVLSATGSQYKEQGEALKNLAISLGEDPTDVVETKSTYLSKNEVTGNVKSSSQQTYTPKKGTKTYEYLKKAQDNGIYDTFNWSDQSLSSDDSTISKFIKNDYRKTQSYKNNLKNFTNKLAENKIISVPATNKKLFGELAGFASGNATETGASFTVNQDENLNIRDIDKDYVEVNQNYEDKDGKVINKSVKILKRDLYSNFPSLVSKVDFENQQGVYSFSNLQGKKIPSSPISFQNNTDMNTKLYTYRQEVLLDTPQLQVAYSPFLTEEDTRNYISNGRTTSGYLQSTPEAKKLLNSAIKNSNKFSFNLEAFQSFKSEKLSVSLVDKTTGEKVKTLTLDGSNFQNISLDKFMEVYNTAPNLLYGQFLTKIVEEQAISSAYGDHSESFTKLAKILNK